MQWTQSIESCGALEKYCPIVLLQFYTNTHYQKPPEAIINHVAGEKKSRKGFKKGLNEKKLDVQRKSNIKDKLETFVKDEEKEKDFYNSCQI